MCSGGDTLNASSFTSCLNIAGQQHLSPTPGILPVMAQIPLKTPTDSQYHTRKFRTEGASEDPVPAPSRIDLKARKGCSRPFFVECSVSPSNLQSLWATWEFLSLQPVTCLLLIHYAPLGSVVPAHIWTPHTIHASRMNKPQSPASPHTVIQKYVHNPLPVKNDRIRSPPVLSFTSFTCLARHVSKHLPCLKGCSLTNTEHLCTLLRSSSSSKRRY